MVRARCISIIFYIHFPPSVVTGGYRSFICISLDSFGYRASATGHTSIFSKTCFSSASSTLLSCLVSCSVLGQGLYFVPVRARRTGWLRSCWQGHCLNGSSGAKWSQQAHYDWQPLSSVSATGGWGAEKPHWMKAHHQKTKMKINIYITARWMEVQ